MKLLGAYNDTGINSLILSNNQYVVQSFVSPLNNLNQVDLIFTQAPKLQPALIKLSVIDPKTNLIVASSQAQLNPNQIHSFISFPFPLIKNSQNNLYNFKISLSDSLPEPVSLKMTPDNYYQNGHLALNNLSISGDLVFRTYHTTTQTYFKAIISPFFENLKQDPKFFIFYFLLLFLLGYKILCLLNKVKKSPIVSKGKHILFILFALWISVLCVRSFTHLSRIIKESTMPVKNHLPHIIGCNNQYDINQVEQKYLYYYKSLGKCQN